MTENEYRSEAAEKGYAEPVVKSWAAGHFNDFHTHDLSLFLFIQEGAMSLDIERPDGVCEVTCGPGESVEVPANVVHTERVGEAGVTFLVARK